MNIVKSSKKVWYKITMWSLIGFGSVFLLFGLITSILPEGGGSPPRDIHVVASGITTDAHGNYHLTISSRETPIFIHATPSNNTTQLIEFLPIGGIAESIIQPIASITPGNVAIITVENADLIQAFANHPPSLPQSALQILISSDNITRFLNLTFAPDARVVDFRYSSSLNILTPGVDVIFLGPPATGGALTQGTIIAPIATSLFNLIPNFYVDDRRIDTGVVWNQAILLSNPSSGVNLNLHNNDPVYVPQALLAHVAQNQPGFTFEIHFLVTATYLGRTYMNFFNLRILRST